MKTKETILKEETVKINKQLKKDKKEFIESLKECKNIKDITNKWFLNQYLTDSMKKETSISEVKKRMLALYDKRKETSKQKKIAHLNAILNSGEITEIKVSIEWVKNQIWGANPHADIQIFGSNYECLHSGSISGCGYDKESTAFAHAINQSLAFNKLLLMNANKIKDEYGHSHNGLSGGVGVSCYYRIFEKLGYKMTNVASGKMFNSYHIVKK